MTSLSAQLAWERSLIEESGRGGVFAAVPPFAAPLVVMDQDNKQMKNIGEKDPTEQPSAHEKNIGDSDDRDASKDEQRRHRSPSPKKQVMRVRRSRFSSPPPRSDQNNKQAEKIREKDGRPSEQAPAPEKGIEVSDDRDVSRNEQKRRHSPSPEKQVKMARRECMFYRWGNCRNGNKCNYSHDIPDSKIKPEFVCRFFRGGFCRNGDKCNFSHQLSSKEQVDKSSSVSQKTLESNLLSREIPCKDFHKGECSLRSCEFSHEILTKHTRPIFEQMMRDEENAKFHLPAPLAHKVLLPVPPVSAAEPALWIPVPNIEVLPPPSIVIPKLASVPPRLPLPPAVVPQPSTALLLPPPPCPSLLTVPAKPVETPAIVQPTAADPSPVSFNIDNLLAQLASKSASNVVEESPASPTMNDEAVPGVRLIIPSTRTIAWRLVPVDVANPPYLDSSNQIINMTMRNDPRMSRLISSQFDAVSSIIGKSVPTSEPAPSSLIWAIPSTHPVDSRAVTSMHDPRRRPTEQQRSSDDRQRSWFPDISSSGLFT